MTTLLYVALAYWAFCASAAVGMLYVSWSTESARWKGRLLRRLPSPRREITIAFGAVVLVLVSPVLLPYCLVAGYVQCRRQAKAYLKLKRSHRDNVYERMHPVNLPKIARRYFEEHAPDLLDLGFHEIGRYQLKPQPIPSYGFCFQSLDGRAVGVLGNMFTQTYACFTTLFANGMVLETTTVEPSPRLERVNTSSSYRVAFSPGTTIAEAFLRHEDKVATIEAEFDTRTLAFEPDQFRDVLTYEGRVFSQFLYEQGERDAPPPPAILPYPIRPELARGPNERPRGNISATAT
jgi:hypothetical protein